MQISRLQPIFLTVIIVTLAAYAITGCATKMNDADRALWNDTETPKPQTTK